MVLEDPLLLLWMFLALLPTIVFFFTFNIVCATFWLVIVLKNEIVLAGMLCNFLDWDDRWLGCLRSFLASWTAAHCVVKVVPVKVVKAGLWTLW